MAHEALLSQFQYDITCNKITAFYTQYFVAIIEIEIDLTSWKMLAQ